METSYYKLTDKKHFGEIVKVTLEEPNPPKAFQYDVENKEWYQIGGFFFEYMLPEDDNHYDEYEEISEKEALEILKISNNK